MEYDHAIHNRQYRPLLQPTPFRLTANHLTLMRQRKRETIAMQFYIPESPGEWLAWLSAFVTMLFGLALLVAPRVSLRLLRLRTVAGHPEAVSGARATMAGFYLGVGLAAIAFAQPFLWIALGAGWGFTVFGRLVSIVADHGFTPYNGVSILVEALLAALPLGFAFGYI